MNRLLHDEKNIDSIFFYAINDDINYLGFFYTINGIKYKKDYKDINFYESVERIIKVYNTLKEVRQINLIGDLTKDIISRKIILKNKKTYNKTLLNSNKYDYLSMKDYIDLIITNTLSLLNIEVSFLKEIPIIFYKTDKGYKLKYRILFNNKDYIFDCDINIFNKSIIVEINNKEYTGEIIFDKLNIDNSIIFKKSDSIVYSKSLENELTDVDKINIKKVFDLIGFDYEIDGIKTIDNNYILYNTTDEYEYYIKLNIHDNLIRINLEKYTKFIKDGIDFKAYEEKYDYIITKYNDNNILIQQQFLISNNLNSELKANINKSRYYLVETDNNSKLIESKIIKRKEIKEKLETIEDIKKLTLKKE